MKTSYYAKFSRLKDKDKYIPIAISVGVPKWFNENNFRICYEFMPPYEIVEKKKNGEITEIEFEHIYKENILSKCDIDEAYDYFMGLEESLGREVVFLCHETSDKFCHRHLIDKFFKENIGISIEELQ